MLRLYIAMNRLINRLLCLLKCHEWCFLHLNNEKTCLWCGATASINPDKPRRARPPKKKHPFDIILR
jgi:ribosomal protein L40E